MTDQDNKVLEILEQIFNFAQKKNSIATLSPKINEAFECTNDSECKRCPEWLKSRPQHGWKIFIVEPENAEEEARRRQWRGDWCGECFYEGELTRCTCGGGPLAEMSEFQQDMRLVEHFRYRLDNNIEDCDCGRCWDVPLAEASEMVYEITEYWNDVQRDTH